MSDRCTGHCCKVFSLPYDPAGMEARKKIFRDGEKVVDMIIYLGEHPSGMLSGSPKKDRALEAPTQHYYTCKHHDAETGDCKAYDARPDMCSGFPYGQPCPYETCSAGHLSPHVPTHKLLAKVGMKKYEEKMEAKEAHGKGEAA